MRSSYREYFLHTTLFGYTHIHPNSRGLVRIEVKFKETSPMQDELLTKNQGERRDESTANIEEGCLGHSGCGLAGLRCTSIKGTGH